MQNKKRSRKPAVIAILVIVIFLVGAFALYTKATQKDNQSQTDPVSNTTDDTKEPAKPALVDLQPVVDEWAAAQRAEYSIVVYDPANKQVIATREADKPMFAASLYKLFVAYLALVDFESGAQDPSEIFIADQTKKQCVDKMIRESDSPCGESMMAEMGQQKLRERVAEMGIRNTIFAGITTTAADSALILQYIVEGRDLNAQNTAFLRDAMRVQPDKYRRGLATGAPEAIWETKVGWNEQSNYHDIGIMTLPNGREYVVAILGQGSGSPAPIADFAKTIFAKLNT